EVRPINGHIFLTYKYTRIVELPGLTVHLLKGPTKEVGAVYFFENLYRSSEARTFLENLQQVRGTSKISKIVSLEMLENRLVTVIRTRGEEELNHIRDD